MVATMPDIQQLLDKHQLLLICFTQLLKESPNAELQGWGIPGEASFSPILVPITHILPYILRSQKVATKM